jgi:hypothetical protein
VVASSILSYCTCFSLLGDRDYWALSPDDYESRKEGAVLVMRIIGISSCALLIGATVCAIASVRLRGLRRASIAVSIVQCAALVSAYFTMVLLFIGAN